MSTNLDIFRNALGILEETLGPELIKKEVHKLVSWNPESTPNFHPLVLLWYKAREDLATAELTESLPHSRWVVETLQMGAILTQARSHPQYKVLLENLRDPLQYATTVGLLRVGLNNECHNLPKS